MARPRRKFPEPIESLVQKAGKVNAVIEAMDVPPTTFHRWVAMLHLQQPLPRGAQEAIERAQERIGK
jgi:hypothetical protein